MLEVEAFIITARCVGDSVGCRLVKVGIDLDTLTADSCFSVENGESITVGVDCIRSNTLIGSRVGAIDERSMRNTRNVGDGVGCRLVKVGIELDTASVGNCFSVGNGAAIAIDDRSVKNAGCVGDVVVCRLVKVGTDSAAFGLSSFFSVGEGVGIAVEDDGGRSIPLVRSRVDAIDGSGEGKLVGCVAGVS